MSFGRKYATRALLAYLAPLTFMLVVGSVFAYFAGYDVARFVLDDVIILVPALLIGRLLTRPDAIRLAQLRSRAEQLERGDFQSRLPVAALGDEYADLARAFNHMADVIAARESALREQNAALAALNQRMESVLNATNDGIALLNREGRFALVNRRFCEMLGTRPDALLHRSLEEAQPLLIERLAHPERLISRMAALTPADLRDPVGVSEEVMEMTAPERRSVQVYTAPVQDAGDHSVIGRIVALRDITRERELDKMKTDFISVVSHELRTPLTSIKGYTDLLLSGAAGETSELQGEFLGIVQSSTTRLSNLINDILDISRIESGRIAIKHEPIDYRQIVSDTLRLMRAAADEKGIAMDASLPETMPLVRGDTDKVTQVLTNLVSNAIKYTPPGGWIKVMLDVTGSASVTTCVMDSGIGIAPDDQKKLFQKFFRADNTSTREAGGTGLGLVIAKTIVELLGGAIWVESESGSGTRFYFTLPLSLETGETGEPGTVSAPREAVLLPERGIGLVLVVDDDAYVRDLTQHHLHRRGYGTLGAASCEDALQKARQHKPDALTLDMMMPDLDGFHLLRALKGDPATAGIPVLIVSVVGDPARGALSLGAFSFAQKPLDEAHLAHALAAAVSVASDKPLSVLFVGGEAAGEGEAGKEIARPVWNGNGPGITLHRTGSPADAIAYTITHAPDVVLLDMAMPETALFEFISALKAEEEAARIPIVLLADDIADTGIHFHLGSDAADNTASLDYLCEQLGRILPAPARAK